MSHGQPTWIYQEIIKPIFCINYHIFRHVGSLYLRLKDETTNNRHFLLHALWLKFNLPSAALLCVILAACSPYLCLQSEILTFILLVRRICLISLLIIFYLSDISATDLRKSHLCYLDSRLFCLLHGLHVWSLHRTCTAILLQHSVFVIMSVYDLLFDPLFFRSCFETS